MTDAPPGSTAVPSTFAIPHLASADNGKHPSAIAGDILYGADEVALFLFGDRKHRRRVYHLVDSGCLPVFRIGINICARKSTLLEWILTQERRYVGASR